MKMKGEWFAMLKEALEPKPKPKSSRPPRWRDLEMTNGLLFVIEEPGLARFRTENDPKAAIEVFKKGLEKLRKAKLKCDVNFHESHPPENQWLKVIYGFFLPDKVWIRLT
jgi:hypothetical protein